jgi:hypothetical protein
VSLRTSDVDGVWKKFEFTFVKRRDHVVAQLWLDGKMMVKTKRSHGSGKIDGQVPHWIRNQMMLNESQFADAIRCPLTKEQYHKIVRDADKRAAESAQAAAQATKGASKAAPLGSGGNRPVSD